MNSVGKIDVLYVHGLFSSGKAWSTMQSLLRDDAELAGRVSQHDFEYDTPKVSVNPTRKIPNLDTVAEAFMTYIDTHLAPANPLLIVSHSQGGLIALRYLVKMLDEGRGEDLQRVRGLMLYATPNSGSEFFLSLRRSLFLHPQERELRPFTDSLNETTRRVMRSIVYAQKVGSQECPIPIVAFAGESDRVVAPASARAVYPRVGVLPGDHSSIIVPSGPADTRYQVLRREVLRIIDESDMPPLASVNPPVESAAEVPTLLGATSSSEGEKALIVRALVQVDELIDSSTRDEIVRFLPRYISLEVDSGQRPRAAIMSLVNACDRFGEVSRSALIVALDVACPPEDPRVQHAKKVVKEVWHLADIED